jgi:type VI secretion system protein ImpL
MKSAIGLLLSRWSLSFVGTVLLAGVIWWFGPLLPPLDEDWPRAALAAAMLLAWAAANLLIDRRRRRRDETLRAGITAAGEEVAALSDRLNQALRQLKAGRGVRGYLYEQPWYAIIGPPGAGKTTALLNAGLNFPLAKGDADAAIGGVGGTRLCDWWFTDQAVLIDTAGRYTTQDSDADVDRAGWEGFLDLLKRTRARQALNGVIVGIALSDIALATPTERAAHARAIRRRIDELETRLSVRMPVYALLTKADLIAGFTEFFDDLDSENRGQVWGTTFPPTDDPAAGFAPAFADLVARLNGRLLSRLQSERNADRRALIAGFPTQVASLGAPLIEFLTAAFGASQPDSRPNWAPFLRGVYMTSGTQEGTPIDRLTGSLARAFGLDQARAAALKPIKGRSYFLRRLLSDVVFNEAMLVAEPPSARRRRHILRTAAFSLILLPAIGAGVWLWLARETNATEVATVATALHTYEQEAGAARLDPVNDADLPAITALLDRARTLPYGYEATRPAANAVWPLSLLMQDSKLSTASQALYRHALERVLLPRLLWRLEAQMRGALNQPDFLYEATRVYLMLGGGGPLDRELVHVWMRLDWEATYPDSALREALLRHLDVLLADPLPAVALDGALVTAARATFGRVSFVQRVYSRIPGSAAAQRLPPWKPRDALGAAGATLFTRASGRSLDDGIPGFYTPVGFHQVLLPALSRAAVDVAAESWVLGQKVTIDAAGPEMQALQAGVVALYEADFTRLWDGMIGDLDLIPVRSLAQAAQGFYILASTASPMRALLVSMARQLSLAQPDAATNTSVPATSDDATRLAGLLRGTAQPAPTDRPAGFEIDARYKPLRDLVGNGPGAPIDQVLKILNDLQQQLAKLAVLAPGAAAPSVGPEDPAVALKAAADKEPAPFGRWLASVASSGAALRSGGAKQQIISVYNIGSGPGPTCARIVNNHYPFAITPALTAPPPPVPPLAATTSVAPAEAGLDEFGRLFAQGGLLDGFFNTQLRPYVAISSRGWRPQAVDGVPAPVTQADLDQFQRAAAIRALFFTGGGTSPSLRFDITPISVDKGATKATLDFDGTAVTFPDGAAKATQITWPGPTRMLNVKLTWDSSASIAETGPWALLRMFAHGKIQPASAGGKFTVVFSTGEREATFELHTASPGSPFTSTALRDFHCPNVQ